MWCKQTCVKYIITISIAYSKQPILTNYLSLTLPLCLANIKLMFESVKSPVNGALFLGLLSKALCPETLKDWCKYGVKLQSVKIGRFLRTYTNPLNRPGLLYRYNTFNHNAPIAQWQCNALVMHRYLVSTGWGHTYA